MLSPDVIRGQVEVLTADLIQMSLCNDQRFPSMRSMGNDRVEIGIGSACDFSVSLKDIPYRDIYRELERTQAYNVKMLDGALLQMMYRFSDSRIESHRLAFFPSPYLEEFQNNPDVYLEDDIYAEVIRKSVVPFPLRFDFESSDRVYKELDHPRSHLTLGQYSNCRIPVSAPLTPYHFMSFILRSFYHTAYTKMCESLSPYNHSFRKTIAERETGILHVQIPSQESQP